MGVFIFPQGTQEGGPEQGTHRPWVQHRWRRGRWRNFYFFHPGWRRGWSERRTKKRRSDFIGKLMLAFHPLHFNRTFLHDVINHQYGCHVGVPKPTVCEFSSFIWKTTFCSKRFTWVLAPWVKYIQIEVLVKISNWWKAFWVKYLKSNWLSKTKKISGWQRADEHMHSF